MIWTTWRPRWLPWYFESYIDGVHIFDKPQPWLFPLFPWAAFAFAGLAARFILLAGWARVHEAQTITLLGAGGFALGWFAWWLDAQPRQLYANYDFWHTSPNFFLIRVGILMMVLLGAYVWCRWGAGQKGFSPMNQMGHTSLLVYWVHIELVYGSLSILTKGSQTVARASFGLAVIFVLMVLLSIVRTNTKGKGAEILAWLKGEPGVADA
jgi:fucose 4-O-acetylase-like acetyltransferase